MVELSGDLGPLGLNGFSQGREPGDEFIVPDAKHVHSSAGLIDGAASDDDQGCAPFGPFHKVIGMMGKDQSFPGGKVVHSRHDDPVFEFHLADFDGGEEQLQHFFS
jgi:hypothetical protein